MSSIPVDVGTLPSNFCPSNYQDLANGLGTIMSVNTGSGSSATVTISNTKPSDTTVVWARIDSLGRFIGIYIYGQGAWLQAHPMVPGSTIWWFNALPNFSSFDGGDSGSLGPQSGPMWQQAKDYNGTLIAAQFILTPGTLPSGSVISIGGTGGEELHVLLDGEQTVPSTHQHIFGSWTSGASAAQFAAAQGTDTASGLIGPTNIGAAGSPNYAPLTKGSGWLETGPQALVQTASGHNTLPVYTTGFLLQRTSRLFYAVN